VAIVNSSLTATGITLSNPSELINLVGIAEPGLGPPQAAFGRYLRACGGPVADPYSCDRSSGRVGAAIWQRVWELCASPGRRPVFRGDFERPCHAAINVQIPINVRI